MELCSGQEQGTFCAKTPYCE